jgi:hypothetical protein
MYCFKYTYSMLQYTAVQYDCDVALHKIHDARCALYSSSAVDAAQGVNHDGMLLAYCYALCCCAILLMTFRGSICYCFAIQHMYLLKMPTQYILLYVCDRWRSHIHLLLLAL